MLSCSCQSDKGTDSFASELIHLQDVNHSLGSFLMQAQAFVLHLPANVNISASRAEHSMHSGELIVHMPKADAIMTTLHGKLRRNATSAASLRR